MDRGALSRLQMAEAQSRSRILTACTSFMDRGDCTDLRLYQ